MATTRPRPDPYAGLRPDAALDALEAAGWRGDGRVLQLNSFENRVWLVHLEDGGAVVVKFYRPDRWSDAQILEEHAFSAELAADEVPLAAPLADLEGRTLFHLAAPDPTFPPDPSAEAAAAPAHPGWRFAVFERRPGRGPELEQPGVLRRIGHFLGRLHAVGGRRGFEQRPVLDLGVGAEAQRTLLDGPHLPPTQRTVWQSAADDALRACEAVWQALGPTPAIRLHGDCHLGNILWTEGAGPHFVDLDDAVAGPAVQDLWMLAADGDEARERRDALIDGYETFQAFDDREWHRVEALRTLRMLHHSAWIARRWNDPAFPAAFPWFGTEAYWSQQVAQLREQVPLLLQAAEAAAAHPRWS